jgi:multiple sugar transport system ATP-binding protein
MAGIELQQVTKRYPDGTEGVKTLDLDVGDGEFMILVGPSGCGKSTALRMVAGLEEITEGELLIGGRRVNDVAPKDRDIAMVFQNYALYPHMTVRENMGYALKKRKLPKDEIDRKVTDTAEVLDLTEHLDRKPGTMSGGQRQRVAMGRAIVREPQAFLMDEPLSNLDAKLRVGMRAQLASLHARLQTTTIYVTHDQVEAMTLGQRVAVMRDGRVLQVDTPQILYAEPANLFVAAFIGSPAMNLAEARLGDGVVEFAGFRIPAPSAPAIAQAIVGIRPEAFEDAELGSPALPTIEVTAEVVEDLGADAHVIFPIDAPPIDVSEVREAAGDEDVLLPADRATFTARVDPATSARPGAGIRLSVDPSKFHYFDPATGLRLEHAPVPALARA